MIDEWTRCDCGQRVQRCCADCVREACPDCGATVDWLDVETAPSPPDGQASLGEVVGR